MTFTREFVGNFNCHDTLHWGINKTNKVVDTFCRKFPHGSWVMFWGYLAWEISDAADRKIALRASQDLQRFIDYADPTGDTAVANVMSGL